MSVADQSPEKSSAAEAAPPPTPGWRARLRWTASPERLTTPIGHAIYWLLVILPALGLIGYLFPPINHDVGAELDVARRWLAGDRLYVDIIDINTPMVFLIHAIPEFLANQTGMIGAQWMTICTIVAILGSFWACMRVLARLPFEDHPLTRAFLPPTLMFLLAVIPNDMFAQREHLLVIAAMPYLMAAAARAKGEGLPLGLRIGVGLAAGIGFALKPQFIAIPIMVELYIVYCIGWRAIFRDIVPWLVGGLAVAHVAFVVVATPEYFTFLIPLVLEVYARIGDENTLDVLTGPLIGPTLLALAPLTAASFVLSRSKLARTIAVFAVGGVLSAVIQAKGWRYQTLPALSATLLLASVTFAGVIDKYLPHERAQQRFPVAMLTGVFMILFYYQQALFNPPYYKQVQFDDSPTAKLIHIVKTQAPHRSVLVLSPGIYPHYPMINYTGAQMAMRFQTMWPLQGIYADCEEFEPLYNKPERMSAVEAMFFNSVSDDFARIKPDLLIVDKIAGVPRCQYRSFDYLEYFQRNPAFAETFRDYLMLIEFDRYAIYKRR